MDGALIAQEIQASAQAMYPALPPDQALLQYYRDLYNSVPESIRSQLPEIGVALGELSGIQYVVFLCRIARILLGESKSGTTIKRPILIPPVEQNNISFINGSLNSDSRFANAVTCAAFIGAALAVKVGNDAISRIGSALDAIRKELSIQNIAKVQGWVAYTCSTSGLPAIQPGMEDSQSDVEIHPWVGNSEATIMI
ncbi:hypothetical protein INS49_012121 [Diaporthe citri]|uniref:uncharacterized protein n=1 Tax=Diaporthe citri TaxID=83186 RepID=UPI001C7F7282|nr:uncharacterized protein INS49_012121 [Diaporthe citri]KAG6358603.1 hypothetical protein INS49_012121 [Diaporthe citri]